MWRLGTSMKDGCKRNWTEQNRWGGQTRYDGITLCTCMQHESDRRAISIAGTQTGRAPRSVRRAASFVAYWRGAVKSTRRFDSGRLTDPGVSMKSDKIRLMYLPAFFTFTSKRILPEMPSEHPGQRHFTYRSADHTQALLWCARA